MNNAELRKVFCKLSSVLNKALREDSDIICEVNPMIPTFTQLGLGLFLNKCRCGGRPIVDYRLDAVTIKCDRCGKKCGCAINLNHPDEWVIKANLAYNECARLWNAKMKGENNDLP